MAYTAPGTLANPWDLTKANTYLEANSVSLRRYIQATLPFSQAFVMSTTSGGAAIYTSPSLCSTVPDEATKMIVCVFVEEGSIISGTPATMNIWIKDGFGTVISPALANIAALPVPFGKVVGYNGVFANISPQFSVWCNCNTGSANAVAYGWAMVGPQ